MIYINEIETRTDAYVVELTDEESKGMQVSKGVSVPYQNSKKTEFFHGVSIPLRMLTSSMLTYLRRIYTITLLSILLYFLYFVLYLYINCVTLLSRLIPFFD